MILRTEQIEKQSAVDPNIISKTCLKHVFQRLVSRTTSWDGWKHLGENITNRVFDMFDNIKKVNVLHQKTYFVHQRTTVFIRTFAVFAS